MAKRTPAEMVLAADAEIPVPGENEAPWMPSLVSGDGSSVAEQLASNPKVLEMLRLFASELLLVEPTLRFVRLKAAEIANAKLSVLYSPEELEELKAKVREIEQ